MDDGTRAHREQIDELLSSTFNSILRIEERALDNRLTDGLSISEIHTIAAVGYRENDPMGMVAARLGVTLATLTTAVGKLVLKGYVKRERDAQDKRKVLISLTDKGRQVHRAHHQFHKKMTDDALSTLDVEEERALLAAMVKIDAFFREQAQRPGYEA